MCACVSPRMCRKCAHVSGVHTANCMQLVFNGPRWLREWFKRVAHLFQEWSYYNMFKAEGRYIGAELPRTTFLLLLDICCLTGGQ